MVKRSKGLRKRSRQIMRKSPRTRGMPPPTRSLVNFEVGDTVNIVIEPSVHKGQPYIRFQGRAGTVMGKQGKAFVLNVKVGGMVKKLIVGPEHLRRQEG